MVKRSGTTGSRPTTNSAHLPFGKGCEHRGYADSLSFDDEWNIDHQLVFTDPQTNGGLLLSVAPDQVDFILAGLREQGCPKATVIGEVTAYTGTDAPVIFKR